MIILSLKVCVASLLTCRARFACYCLYGLGCRTPWKAFGNLFSFIGDRGSGPVPFPFPGDHDRNQSRCCWRRVDWWRIGLNDDNCAENSRRNSRRNVTEYESPLLRTLAKRNLQRWMIRPVCGCVHTYFSQETEKFRTDRTVLNSNLWLCCDRMWKCVNSTKNNICLPTQ